MLPIVTSLARTLQLIRGIRARVSAGSLSSGTDGLNPIFIYYNKTPSAIFTGYE